MDFLHQQSGIIALDLDGTVTVNHAPIEPEVIDYLTQLNQIGWKFIFITGRTFAWGYEILKALPFPYFFAVQNGAIVLEMPSCRIVAKKYLTKDVIPVMEEICEGEPTDFVVYTGFENKDMCYYRPAHFEKWLDSYLRERARKMNEIWNSIATFDEMPFLDFPSLKCFGLYESASKIAEHIEKRLGLHIPLIRDPFNEEYYVAQATHPEADKGEALREFLRHHPAEIVIAAGDDLNDMTMLKVATCRVVMATAPQIVLEMADIIAPPAKDKGIITGLKKAIKLC